MLIILILIIYFTLNNILDKKSLKAILKVISNIRFYYVIIGLFLISFYFLLQGIYMKLILESFKIKIPLKKGIFYSLIEFFFSGITPSSTGGQPVQLYYMKKDKIPIKNSYITLLLNTIYFKIILVFLGIFVILLKRKFIFSNDFVYVFFFKFGFISDLIFIFICFLLLFNKNVIKKILTKLYSILNRFKKIKKENNIDKIINEYNNEINSLKNNKKVLLLSFIITFIQRISMFSIAYLIYRALGFNKYNYVDLLTIQVSVQLAIEILPIPGGSLLSEMMMYDMFSMIFLKNSEVAMLLTRTFSFYIPILTSGFVILIYDIHIKLINKRKSKKIA